MSLINQMLKDLERRADPPNKQQVSLSGLQLMSGDHEGSAAKKWFKSAVILSFGIVFFMTAQEYYSANKHGRLLNSPMHDVVYAKELAPAINLENTPLQSPAMLTGVALQAQGKKTLIRMLLSQDVFYQLSTTKDNRELLIYFEHATLNASLPMINSNQFAIEKITAKEQKNGGLTVKLMLLPNSEIQHIELTQAEKLPELQLEIAEMDKPASSASNNRSASKDDDFNFIKKLVINAPAEQDYKEALRFMSAGRVMDAKHLLARLVNQFPNFNSARESLAELLFQQGKQVEAKKLIQQGLKRQPDFIPFTELSARILVQQNKVKRAIRLLEDTSPPMEHYPEHYAFLAALYQRNGHSDLAEQLYKQLVQTQSAKSIWWVGLAIALDSNGKTMEAMDVYKNIRTSNDLSPNLRTYIETYLHEHA